MDGGLFDSTKQVLLRLFFRGQERKPLAIPQQFSGSPKAKVLYAIACERSLGEAELVFLTELPRQVIKEALDSLMGRNLIRRVLVSSTTAPNVDTAPAYSLTDVVSQQRGSTH